MTKKDDSVIVVKLQQKDLIRKGVIWCSAK